MAIPQTDDILLTQMNKDFTKIMDHKVVEVPKNFIDNKVYIEYLFKNIKHIYYQFTKPIYREPAIDLYIAYLSDKSKIYAKLSDCRISCHHEANKIKKYISPDYYGLIKNWYETKKNKQNEKSEDHLCNSENESE